jgi:hypothetical protein
MLRKKPSIAWVFACFICVSLMAQTANNLKLEDLSVDSSPAEIAKAHADLKNGTAILRVTGGSQKDIQRLIGVPLLGATVKAASGATQASRAQLLNKRPLQMTGAAAYKDEKGVIRSAVVFSSPTSTEAKNEESLANSLNRWIEREQARQLGGSGEDDGPKPPEDAWTAVYRQTILSSDDYKNQTELTLGVFRLNTISKSSDYYMVATVPQTNPNFGGTCHGLHCDWHTIGRSIYMGPVITEPPSDNNKLIDHGPTGTITDKETGFEVGGDLSKEAAFSAGYSEHWSTPSVVTTDSSDYSKGQGHWEEAMQFSGAQCDPTSAPPVSTGGFLSRQAGIFEVPAETRYITAPVEFDAHFCYFDLGYNWAKPVYSDISLSFSSFLWPPALEAYPASITIPAGGTGTISITADIPGSEEGFSWTAESNDTLVATIPSRGPFSTGRLLPITIKPDVKEGETATIAINSDPPYGTPSVRTGPLEVSVTVGTPKRQTATGVLLVGGNGPDGIESSAQVYDYTRNQIYDAPPLNVARIDHTATRLKGGRVLVVGGATQRGLAGNPDTVTATAEIYDPSSLKWIPTGSLNTARERHTATRLPDGKVLITGGIGTGGAILASAELYDPATGKFTLTGNMAEARDAQYAVLLPESGNSAKVLVYGGFTPGGAKQNGAEIWDESRGTFTAAGATAPRAFWTPYTPKPVRLESGELDIVGGRSEDGSVTGDEVLLMLGNPPSFSESAEKLNHPRYEHTLTALPNNEGLLVTGGKGEGGSILEDAEIRDANGWSSLDAKMISPRKLHTATLLPNGEVFIAGGDAAPSPIGSSELYDPKSKEFTAGPEMLARSGHTATLFSITTTVLAISPSNPISGESVALSAQVTAGFGTPTGSVKFLDGSSVIATATLSDGQALASYNKFTVGSHTLTAVYSGNDFNGESTSEPVALKVALAGSSVGLSSSVNPSQFGQPVTFTATVQLQSGTGDAATGTIIFKDGDAELDTEQLKNNQASYTDHSLAIGSHKIMAVYSGDATHGGGTSPVIDQRVTQQATNTTLTATPRNPVFGDAVILSSTVSYAAKALRRTEDLTGTVSFKKGDTVLGAVAIKDNKAVLKIDSLHAGSHSFTATYSGDSNSSGSTSPTLALTVSQASTKTSLDSSKNPSEVGEAVTFIAHVSSSAGNPSGTVSFSDGDKLLGTRALINGEADLSTSALSAGTHSITAAYSGDADFLSSASAPVQQRVESAKVETSTSVSGAPNPAEINAEVTFTVKVTPVSGTNSPTGSVILKDGESVLATLSLAGGSATFRTSSLSAGKHSITASYEGDADFHGSTSPVFTEEVNELRTPVVDLSSEPNPSKVGEQVTFTVKVSSPDGPTPQGNVTISEPLPGGGNPIYGNCNLNSKGECAVLVNNLTAGKHEIYATYGGEQGVYTGAQSKPVYQAVDEDTAEK